MYKTSHAVVFGMLILTLIIVGLYYAPILTMLVCTAMGLVVSTIPESSPTKEMIDDQYVLHQIKHGWILDAEPKYQEVINRLYKQGFIIRTQEIGPGVKIKLYLSREGGERLEQLDTILQ